MNFENKYITLEYDFDGDNWEHSVNVNDCFDEICMAIEKEYKDKFTDDGFVAIETYLAKLFEDGDIELKRQLAIHYKEDLENSFREFAYEDYWETIGREKQADLQAEAEDYENERSRDRREL
ncbi:MAG: hypothetical protein M0R51_17020 [Clostridia bacterium]|jgi:hypothetical protein|nr:hypothetical protein [Clostridia bacterium]